MKITTNIKPLSLKPQKNKEFTPQRFDEQDGAEALESFSQDGRVYYKRAGVFKKDLTANDAADRLNGGYYRESEHVFVELADGKTHKLESLSELQRLDTFQGLGLKPVEPPSVVEALKTLDKGVDENDGLIRDGYAITPEKRLNAFEAHHALTTTAERAGRAALKGAGIGAGVAVGLGLVALGASALFPNLVPSSISNSLTNKALLAAGGASLATGAIVGSATGFVSYKNAHPKELEVRNGQDSGLKIQNLDHAVEIHNWLEERAENPFTDAQQRQALGHLSKESGLYQGRKEIEPSQALKRLKQGKAVHVPSSIPGHSDTMNGVRHLQQMDTVRGLGLNPVLPQEVSKGLRFLEAGHGNKDGLYKKDKFEAKHRLSAFEAVDYLFREREPIGAKVHNKNYQTETLKNIQELNALKGDGRNTILPEGPFQGLLFFDRRKLMKTEAEQPLPLDSYEALQEMNDGRAVQVTSKGREARTLEPADLHELRSLEFDHKNDILPQRDFDLLNYWQDNATYRVNGETQNQRGFEALQEVQGGREFEIESANRFAPALTFQDMEDLASFEAPQAGFENNVPPIDQDRLTYFQEANEAKGLNATRVGKRQGRAYEGYRELRDGQPFDVQAAGVWNTVTSPQALHDLDALLGRQVNDILPQDQYDLLKHLGDDKANEGLAASNGQKLNSYAALQKFRDGDFVNYDFHGGDFGELLQIPTENLEALEGTKELRDNQKEYDRYSYPVPEWKNKMERKVSDTPSLASDNLAYGHQNLADGQRKLARGQSDLSDAESDLRSARSDLSYAESELSRARSLPMYHTRYREVCDANNENCRQESYQEYNWERDSAISRAQSLVSDAESAIRRAKSDISDAESLISSARRDIREAEGQISDARQLLSMLPGFQDMLGDVNDSSYKNLVRGIESSIERMKSLSHIGSLDKNLRHQGQLINNMDTRPKRPEGWQIPRPLVQY